MRVLVLLHSRDALLAAVLAYDLRDGTLLLYERFGGGGRRRGPAMHIYVIVRRMRGIRGHVLALMHSRAFACLCFDACQLDAVM